jgi:hypothetical protein
MDSNLSNALDADYVNPVQYESSIASNNLVRNHYISAEQNSQRYEYTAAASKTEQVTISIKAAGSEIIAEP